MTTVASTICDAVDQRQEEIIALLMEAIRIPTETPPGANYDLIVESLIPHFRAVGFEANRYDLPEDVFQERCRRHYPEMDGVRANLLARMPSVTKPGMVFYCHLDTVPTGDRSKWSFDPNDPIVSDGYIWGRGSADSKAGAIAILSAFKVLKELSIKPQVGPVVALTTDEEIGPYTGLMHMADTGAFSDCRWFHSCDGMADSIGVGSLGSFTWSATIRGRSVHSGSSFLGLNPIEHSVSLLQELVSLKAQVEDRWSQLPLSPEVSEATGRTHLGALLNITMARGGVKHNIVPPEFVLEGDRRYIPEEAEADCIEEIEGALARAKKRDPLLDADLATRPFYTAFASDGGDPWVQQVRRVAEFVRGRVVPPAGISGSTDVAHVAKTGALKVTIHGVARHGETRNHGVDERCRIDDLLSVTKVVALLASASYS